VPSGDASASWLIQFNSRDVRLLLRLLLMMMRLNTAHMFAADDSIC
jgi:hypothetical protein